jgi:hypothetical protein
MTRNAMNPSEEGMASTRWDAAKARRTLKSWRASGQTIAQFARDRGLDPWRLYSWRKKIDPASATLSAARVDEIASDSARASFLPVRLTTPVPQPQTFSGGSFEVLMGNGRSVRVPTDFDAMALRQLLGIVGEVL